MQKNNFCLLPNKVLVKEESDTISQSIFNSRASKHNNIKNKNTHKKNTIRTNKNYIKKGIFNINKKFEKYFEKNYNIFFGNILLRKYDFKNINQNNDLLTKSYTFNESKTIFPNREFYFRHHLEFLERPNLINIYFNTIEKEYGLKKSNEYRNQKKKENSIKKKEETNKKIFDTNVLGEIENYSTTITQTSNNEKFATITPFQIFRRCEDNKRLFQKEKNEEKKIYIEKEKEKLNEKDKDTKSKLTFSESCISNYSKNAVDESLIKMIKDLSEKPKKYKQEEKTLKTLLEKKKEVIQKITKFNKNINQKVNGINKFIKKEIKKEKRISTSNNKKNKKLILYDISNQNQIKQTKSNSKTKSNINYPSFNLHNKRKIVFNLKKQSFKKKRHTVQMGDNFKNNMKNFQKKNTLVSISLNNIDDLLKVFFTPNNKKKYGEKGPIIKKQNKKNSALTIVNNVFDNNNQKNSQREERYKKLNKNKLYKSKSPLFRLFKTRNSEKSEENKNVNNKKRKTVLCNEQHNNLLVKSLNFTNRKYIDRNKNRQNNVTLSQNFDSIMKNLIK